LIPLGLRKALRGFFAFKPWQLIFLPLYPLVSILGFKRRKRIIPDIDKILVINLGATGDNLLSTPAIKALKERFPQASIDIMTGSLTSMQAYLNNPRIRRVFRVQQFPTASIKYKFAKKSRIILSTLKVFYYYPTLVLSLLFKNYKLGINFCAFKGGANFSDIIMYLCGIPNRIGGFSQYPELLTAKKENLHTLSWIDSYLAIASLAGAETFDTELEFFLSNDDEIFVRDFLKENNIDEQNIILDVSPGANTYVNNKRWNIANFAEVINKLKDNYNFNLLLLGSREEEQLISDLRKKLKMKAVFLLGAELSKVAALLKKSDILLTNDNAILHLGNAVGVSHIISVFGPTNPTKIVPKNNRNKYLVSRLECAPCIDIDAGDESKKCPRPHGQECFDSVKPDQVYNELKNSFSQVTKTKVIKK
jgi:ADP-heptose:LPS heptosyltransferase